jgi:hypothetical protein
MSVRWSDARSKEEGVEMPNACFADRFLMTTSLLHFCLQDNTIAFF